MVNIFILNWNSLNLIIKRLTELNLIDDDIRVVVINNDDSVIKKESLIYYCSRHDLHIINNGGNLGYAGGNNSGLTYLKEKNYSGDIIIANPDVALTSLVIKSLLSARGCPNFGAAMTAAHDENGGKLYSHIKLVNGFQQKWLCDQTSVRFIGTDYVAGSLFLVAREVVDIIGLFDERYFLYWEEVDLSFRIKDAGFKLYSIPAVSILRTTNSISRVIRSQYYISRNSFLIKNKFPHKFKQYEHFLFILRVVAFNIKLCIQHRRIEPLFNVVKGVLDGLKLKLN